MKGCITSHKLKNGRKSWGYVFTTGYADGKRQQTIKKGFKTEREADEALRIALAPKPEVKVETAETVEQVEHPFGTFFANWLRTKGASPKWGKMTFEQNAKRAAYAIKMWGNVDLKNLTEAVLEDGFAKLLLSGGRNGGPLSPKTVRSIEALVSQALKKAARDKYITSGNPMNNVERTPANKEEVVFPQADEYEKLLDVLQGTRYYAFVVMAAASGCRRGELLALKWSDLDEKGMVTVSKSVSETKAAGLEIKTTKSRKTRYVQLDRSTRRVLLEHRKVIDHDRELFGADYKPHDLMFCRLDGSYYSPDRITNRISEFMAKAGLDASLHSLRHLHASMLLSQHVPIPIVSKRLGHANSQVTLSIYSHAMKNDEAIAAELWDDATGDIIGRTEKRPQERPPNGPLSLVIPKTEKSA